MLELMDDVLTGFRDGRLGRREALARLAALATAAGATARASAAEPPPSTFTSVGLNHVALSVTDVPRSRAFYRRHLGLSVLRDGSWSSFLSCGGNQFLALFRAERPGLHHYCFTVRDYDPAAAVRTATEAGLEPRREGNRVYFRDADGLSVQVSGERDDYPGSPPR